MTPTDHVLRAVASPVMRRSIAGTQRADRSPIGRAEARAVVRRAWETYAAESERLPQEPTPGSRMLVRLACATLTTERALEDAGVNRDEAHRLVAEINWRLYRPLVHLSAWVARRTSDEPHQRLAGQVRRQLGFPFDDPGWQHRVHDELGYDVVRCPIADYLGAHGASEVCTAAFCEQDHRVAMVWRARLRRTTTLADGAERCDFRYEPLP
jgi:hypothetical protein